MISYEDVEIPISRQQEYMIYGENYGERDGTSILAEGRALHGRLDTERMTNSIRRTAELNEALRMVCVNTNGRYKLKIKSSAEDISISYSDNFSDRESALKHTSEIISKSMELEKELFKVIIYSLSETEHILIIIMHHLIADSIALSLVLSEITSIYAGNEPDLSGTARFSEFLEEERLFIGTEKGKVQLEYWEKEMRNYSAPKSDGGGEHFDVIADTAFFVDNRKLNGYASKRHVSGFIVLLSAAHRAAASALEVSDTTIGIAFANRTSKKYLKTVGYLSHLVQNRIIHIPGRSFDELISTVFGKMSENLKYQRLSHYAEMSRMDMGIQDDPLRRTSDVFNGKPAERVNVDISRSVDYILFSAVPYGDRLRINLYCDPSVYSRRLIMKIRNNMRELLTEVLDDEE